MNIVSIYKISDRFSRRIVPMKWSRRDMILLFERLELYIGSGLSVDKSLALISRGLSKKQERIISSIHREIEQGSTLSRALDKMLRIRTTEIGLIAHGESCGQLARALNYCKQLLEREDELVKKCVSAMIYPLVIGLFALGLTLGLMRGVMPEIVPMLRNLNVKLPMITKIVMKISDILTDYGIHISVFMIVSIFLMYISISRYKNVRTFFETAISRVPFVGSILYQYHVSIFIRSFGSLVESGMPSAIAYSHTVSATSFVPLNRICSLHEREVRRGVSLGSVFDDMRHMPRYIPSLIMAGETTGALGAMLTRSAFILDRDIEYSLKKLTSMIEPTMMVMVGCIVAMIALSIMMPIYDLSKVLQK